MLRPKSNAARLPVDRKSPPARGRTAIRQARRDGVTSSPAATPEAASATTVLDAPTHVITRDAVEARLKNARALAASGQSEAALQEYLWCYDTGMRRVDGYFLTRYSEVLDEVAVLGKTYPAALDALRSRRDAARARLMASPTDMESGKDFLSISRVLGDNEATYALFDSLGEDDPRRQFIVDTNIGRLLDAQRYRELDKALPHDGMLRAWEEMTQAVRALPADHPARAQTIAFAAGLAELRAGAGDLVAANDMIERVLVFNSDPQTYAVLRARLQRAGHPELLKQPSE